MGMKNISNEAIMHLWASGKYRSKTYSFERKLPITVEKKVCCTENPYFGFDDSENFIVLGISRLKNDSDTIHHQTTIIQIYDLISCQEIKLPIQGIPFYYRPETGQLVVNEQGNIIMNWARDRREKIVKKFFSYDISHVIGERYMSSCRNNTISIKHVNSMLLLTVQRSSSDQTKIIVIFDEVSKIPYELTCKEHNDIFFSNSGGKIGIYNHGKKELTILSTLTLTSCFKTVESKFCDVDFVFRS
jgi:hypothetical protein